MRMIVFLNIVLGFALLLAVGVRNVVLISLLGLPTAFLIGTVTVPILLWLIPPRLVTGKPGHLIKLDLGHDQQSRGDKQQR